MAYAPQAIQGLYARIAALMSGTTLSGIVGDVYHSFGYHLSRNELPILDYSVTLALDHLGDPDAASALDVSLPPDLMIAVTGRLLAAARARDGRLSALREFCGTTDGINTHPYDLSNGQDGPLNSWDSSHLWHVHLSIYRAYSNDYAAIAPIADVFAGVGGASPSGGGTPIPLSEEDDDMQSIIYDLKGPLLNGKPTGRYAKTNRIHTRPLGPGALATMIADAKANGMDPVPHPVPDIYTYGVNP